MPEMVEFAGAVDCGVAGKDLLDRAGPGARHAEDENRHPIKRIDELLPFIWAAMTSAPV